MRAEFAGAEKFHLDAEAARFFGDLAERAHHAVDLRVPGVGRDQDFHALSSAHAAACAIGFSDYGRSSDFVFSRGRARSSRIVSVQAIISKVPSGRSPTAVQLSTQSPQLM